MRMQYCNKIVGKRSINQLVQHIYFYADFINEVYQFVTPNLPKFDQAEYQQIRLDAKVILHGNYSIPRASCTLKANSDRTEHLILAMHTVVSEQPFEINLVEVLKVMPAKKRRELELMICTQNLKLVKQLFAKNHYHPSKELRQVAVQLGVELEYDLFLEQEPQRFYHAA